MIRQRCPKCKNLLVEPTGPAKSVAILVGDYPKGEEIKSGIPLCGFVTPGKVDILVQELSRVGLHPFNYRKTNMWLHGRNDCDLNWHLTRLAKELKGRKAAFLMGADLSEALFHKSILDTSGLVMKHELFPKTKLVLSISPLQAMRGALGEFRLAVEVFKEVMEKFDRKELNDR